MTFKEELFTKLQQRKLNWSFECPPPSSEDWLGIKTSIPGIRYAFNCNKKKSPTIMLYFNIGNDHFYRKIRATYGAAIDESFSGLEWVNYNRSNKSIFEDGKGKREIMYTFATFKTFEEVSVEKSYKEGYSEDLQNEMIDKMIELKKLLDQYLTQLTK